MKVRKECVICQKYISPARLEMNPAVETCSPLCAKMNKARMQRLIQRRKRSESREPSAS